MPDRGASITLLVVSIARTVLLPELATYTTADSVVAAKVGVEPAGKLIVVTGVALEGEKVETVSSPLFGTYTIVPFRTNAACTGISPTVDCDMAVSPETSIDVLAPKCADPLPLIAIATCENPGLGGFGAIGVATGR